MTPAPARGLSTYSPPGAHDSYLQVVGRLKRTGSFYKKLIIMRMMAVLHAEVAKETGTELTIDHHVKSVVLVKKAALWNDIAVVLTPRLPTIRSEAMPQLHAAAM